MISARNTERVFIFTSIAYFSFAFGLFASPVIDFIINGKLKTIFHRDLVLIDSSTSSFGMILAILWQYVEIYVHLLLFAYLDIHYAIFTYNISVFVNPIRQKIAMLNIDLAKCKYSDNVTVKSNKLQLRRIIRLHQNMNE